jgi:hypothetical protein
VIRSRDTADGGDRGVEIAFGLQRRRESAISPTGWRTFVSASFGGTRRLRPPRRTPTTRFS